MSQGRAIYTMELSHYDEVPKSVSEEIIEKMKGKEAVSA
jgi:elongation factor G